VADKRTWRDLTDTDGYHILKTVINSLHLGGKDAHAMQSNWISFELAIVDKCLPLAIEYMGEFHTVVSQQLRFLTSGTLMRQHTMSLPFNLRARFYGGDHGKKTTTKDSKGKKQHMTFKVSMRIELSSRKRQVHGKHTPSHHFADKRGLESTDQDIQREEEEEEEKLIAKHLKKDNIPETVSSQTKNANTNGNNLVHTDKSNNRWRIWVIIENENGEIHEQFPMDWIENILPGNKHILLTNCKKNNCLMIVYLYVFQSIKLKRKHVCLECANEHECHLWTQALLQLLKFS
ncbi:hypothetical protein RFI_31698, partial [Reticulomyxa filosa]